MFSKQQRSEGGMMNRKSGAFCLPWIPRRQDALPIDGIFALGVGLSAFVLALVAVLLLILLIQPEVPPAIADGVGVGSARGSVLGQYDSSCGEGSKAASVTLTFKLDGTHAPGLAPTGPVSAGPVGDR
jgi:hypothetical protein